MTAFVIRRLMQSVLVMFVMTLIVFFGVNIIGDPVDLLVDPQCTLACLSKAKKALGMHLPLHQQFLVFLGNVSQGDLGDSFVSKTPAVQVILERMPATLELAGSAIMITVVLGIPLGVWAGLKPESWSGRIIMSGSILGFSLPDVLDRACCSFMIFSIRARLVAEQSVVARPSRSSGLQASASSPSTGLTPPNPAGDDSWRSVLHRSGHPACARSGVARDGVDRIS